MNEKNPEEVAKEFPVVFTYVLHLSDNEKQEMKERYRDVDSAMFKSCFEALNTSFVLWPKSIEDMQTGDFYDEEAIRRYWVDKLEKQLPKAARQAFRKLLKRLMPENEDKTTTTHFDR